MNQCEDYPCCGHGPPPLGDSGGCPDEDGRFDCVTCGAKLPKGASSAICDSCRTSRFSSFAEDYDELDESYVDGFQRLASPFGEDW